MEVEEYLYFKDFIWAIACAIWYQVGKVVQKNKYKETEKNMVDFFEAERKTIFQGWEESLAGWKTSNEKLRWAYDHLSKKNQKLYDKEFEDVEDKK